MTTNRFRLYYEFGYRHLVRKCWSVSDARCVLWRGLVPTTGKPGVFAVFLQRGRGGHHFRL